jgi:hypothetical protein
MVKLVIITAIIAVVLMGVYQEVAWYMDWPLGYKVTSYF